MSSPPSSNPPTTTAGATATADFFKSVARQRPRKHVHPAIYQTFYNHQPATTAAFPPPPQRQQPVHSNLRNQHQQSTPLYPVASSGRGFLSKHQDQNVIPPRPISGYPYSVHRFSNSEISGHQLLNPSSAHLQQTFMVAASANPKSSVADDNGLKSTRDKNGDESFVVFRDRKVQVSEGSSLYAQCRSWLKNGSTLESQPQYVDCVKSLPKPLPASIVEEARKEDDSEMEEEINDVEQLSAKELLQHHVKHAKKVRARLRNQRLQRIERYKDRLALLLPPVVDQQPKNDPTS